MITSLNIAEVVCAKRSEKKNDNTDDARFRHAKAAGIYNVIYVETTFRIENVIRRIQKNQEAFQNKFERKMRSELEYMNGLKIDSS
jgi:hypothetical protein